MSKRAGRPGEASRNNGTDPTAASLPRCLTKRSLSTAHIPPVALPVWPSLDEQVAIRAALIYNMVIDPATGRTWINPATGECQLVAELAPAAFASGLATGQKEAVDLSTPEDVEYREDANEANEHADAAGAGIEETEKIRGDLVEFPAGSQCSGNEAITRHRADQDLAEDRQRDGDSRHRQRKIDRLWIVLAAVILAALDVMLLWRPILNLGGLDDATSLYKWVLALAFAGAQAFFIDLAVHKYRERHREAFEVRDAMKDHRRGAERGFARQDRAAMTQPAPPIQDVETADGELRGAYRWLATTACVVGVIGVFRVAFLSRAAGQSIAEATLFGAVVGLVLGGLVLLLGSVACRGNRLGDRLQEGAAVVAEIESRVQEGERRVGAARDAVRVELTAAEDARVQAEDTRAWVMGEYRQVVLLATGWLGLNRPPVDLVEPRQLEIADAAARQVQVVTAKLEVIDRWLAGGVSAEPPHRESSPSAGTALELPAGSSMVPVRSGPVVLPEPTESVVGLSPQLPPPPAEPWWLLLAGVAAAVAVAAAAAFIAPTPEGDGLLALVATSESSVTAGPITHPLPGVAQL